MPSTAPPPPPPHPRDVRGKTPKPSAQPAPVYQVYPNDPERLKIIQTLALLSAALARVDDGLWHWEIGERQMDATRFVLEGRRSALVATIAALEGDHQALKEL